MRRRQLVSVLASLVLLGGSVMAMADEKTKKLGFGFDSGLVAGKDYVAGQLIVALEEGMSTQGVVQAARAMGGSVAKEIDGVAILLEFASEEAAVAAVQRLLARPEVRLMERNGFLSIPPTPQQPDFKGHRKGRATQGGVQTQSVSNDVATGFQWHHTVIRKTAALPALSRTPPTIAVIDTGVDYTHADLSGKVLLGKNSVANNFDPYDDNGHGTHVAGIAAARAGNEFNGEGVCHNCRILAVKVLGANGSGTFFDVVDGMHYAHTFVPPAGVPPVRVLNMSLGGPASALVALEVDHIKAAGKALVAAASNDNSTSTEFAFPGADPDTALRVMATEENDCRAYFSNFSPAATPTRYNIAAPGFEILSTLSDEGFGPLSGTSMASPVVAGAAALVWGQLPALSLNQLVTRLLSNGQLTSCGFAATTRRVDVRRAITGVSETALIGRLLDPFSGKSPSPNTVGALARLFNGATVVGSDLSNRGGSYEMTGLTAGSRTLRGSKAGYNSAVIRTSIPVLANVVTGPFTDALAKTRPAGDATITVDWKTIQPVFNTAGCTGTCNGWELDLLVKLPSGTYIDPFNNPGDLLAAPFVAIPRDSFGDLEPLETAVIRSVAANGVYRVVINRLNTPDQLNPSWVGSRASVQLYKGTASLGLFYATPQAACTTQAFWHVGNLTKAGAAYTWANVNTCTNTLP